MSKRRVLFVCLGNICRSPAAEGIFAAFVQERSLENKYGWDSAGTSAHHQGELADSRMREHAKRRRILLESKSRAFKIDDFDNFDLILTMDNLNHRDIMNLARNDKDKSKIKKMVAYCYRHDDSEVPDPYYGGAEGFEHVLDLLSEGCTNLLNELEKI